MKKSLFYIMTAALLAVVWFSTANADRPNKYRSVYDDVNGGAYYIVSDGLSLVIDTCNGLTLDTMTIRKAENCEGITIGFIPDSISATKTAATDSFSLFYRPVFYGTWLAKAAGSLNIPLLIRSSTGDSCYVCNWTPGAQYWAEEFTPIYAPFQQFFWRGSFGDTIIVKAIIQQIKTKRL